MGLDHLDGRARGQHRGRKGPDGTRGRQDLVRHPLGFGLEELHLLAEEPGASEVTPEQSRAPMPGFGSVTASEPRLEVPVLVTVKV